MTDNVDFAGRMVYDENHDIVFNFGKYKGKKSPTYYVRIPDITVGFCKVTSHVTPSRF